MCSLSPHCFENTSIYIFCASRASYFLTSLPGCSLSFLVYTLAQVPSGGYADQFLSKNEDYGLGLQYYFDYYIYFPFDQKAALSASNSDYWAINMPEEGTQEERRILQSGAQVDTSFLFCCFHTVRNSSIFMVLLLNCLSIPFIISLILLLLPLSLAPTFRFIFIRSMQQSLKEP